MNILNKSTFCLFCVIADILSAGSDIRDGLSRNASSVFLSSNSSAYVSEGYASAVLIPPVLDAKKRVGRAGRLIGINRQLSNCAVNRCLNKGKCTTDVLAVGGFTCECLPGYYGNLCDVVTPDCESNPCKNGAICVVTDKGFRCDCKAGFSGERCQLDGVGHPVPAKGSKDKETMTIVAFSMIGMLFLGGILFFLEHNRQRLLRFNQLTTQEQKLPTDICSVISFVYIDWRDSIFGSRAKVRHERSWKIKKLIEYEKGHVISGLSDDDSESDTNIPLLKDRSTKKHNKEEDKKADKRDKTKDNGSHTRNEDKKADKRDKTKDNGSHTSIEDKKADRRDKTKDNGSRTSIEDKKADKRNKNKDNGIHKNYEKSKVEEENSAERD